MRKVISLLMMALLVCGAYSAFAEASAWFDSAVTTWPSGEETTLTSADSTGSWSAKDEGEAVALATAATCEDGVLALSGGELEFTASAAVKPDLSLATVNFSCVQFSAYEEMPEADVSAMLGSIIVFDDGTAKSFYALAIDTNAVPATNAWMKMSNVVAGEVCEGGVPVKIEYLVDFDDEGIYTDAHATLNVRYTVNNVALVRDAADTAAEGWIPLACAAPTACSLSVIGASGDGRVSMPTGTRDDQDYSPSVDFGTSVTSVPGPSFQNNTIKVKLDSLDLGRAGDLTFSLKDGDKVLATGVTDGNFVTFTIPASNLTVGATYDNAKVVVTYVDYATCELTTSDVTIDTPFSQFITVDDLEYAWFDEGANTLAGSDGSWDVSPTAEDGYLVGDGAMAYTPAKESPTNAAVHVELTMNFVGDNKDAVLSGQAGIKVGVRDGGEGGDEYYVILWGGNQENEPENWLVSLDTDYDFQIDFDYAKHKVTYNYRQSDANWMTETAVTYDLPNASNHVSQLEFQGEMKLKGAVGVYFDEGVSTNLLKGAKGRYASLDDALEADETNLSLDWDLSAFTFEGEGSESYTLDLRGHNLIAASVTDVVVEVTSGTLYITNSLSKGGFETDASDDNSYVVGGLSAKGGNIYVKGGYYTDENVWTTGNFRENTDDGKKLEGGPGTNNLKDAPIATNWYFVVVKSGDDDPGDDPGGDTPGGDTPGGDTPGGDTPGGDTPGGGDDPTPSADDLAKDADAFSVGGGALPNNAGLQSFLAGLGVDISSDSSVKSNAVITALSGNAANGLPKWECYVIGLSATEPTAVIKAANTVDIDTENLTVSIPAANPPADTGYTVKYQAYKFGVGYVGEETTDPNAIKIPVGTGTYRVDVKIYPDNN